MTRQRSPLPVLFLAGFIVLLSFAALAQTVRAVDAVGARDPDGHAFLLGQPLHTELSHE